MILDAAILLLGLLILVWGADRLVEGAAELAASLGVPAVLTGVTVVAFGTSAPELVVAIGAATHDAGGLAIGNIVGSNIANVLLVLGVPALVAPIACRRADGVGNTMVMLAATAVFVAVAYGLGALTTTVGAVFALSVLLFIAFAMRDAVGEEARSRRGARGVSTKMAAGVAVGLVVTVVGAEMLVRGATMLAEGFAVRQELIGLTIVAIGTSAPELATVTAAALRREHGLAVGNVLGSNIFNLLAVGGAIGLAGGARFSPESLRLELPVMVGATLLLAVFVLMDRRIARTSGAVMLAGLAMYTIALGATLDI